MTAWIANLLTLSRVPLAVLFWVTFERTDWAVGVLVLAGATDAVDGRIARLGRRDEDDRDDPRHVGDWLDPVCDKLFVLIVLGAIAVHRQPPPWIVVAIAARELVLVPVVVAYWFSPTRRRGTVHLKARPIGKAATIVQLAAILALFAAHPSAPALAVGAGAIGVIAAVDYTARGVRRARMAAA